MFLGTGRMSCSVTANSPQTKNEKSDRSSRQLKGAAVFVGGRAIDNAVEELELAACQGKRDQGRPGGDGGEDEARFAQPDAVAIGRYQGGAEAAREKGAGEEAGPLWKLLQGQP